MLNPNCFWLLAAAALALAGCSGTSSATPDAGKSTAELISEGEKSLAGGDFNEALGHFDDAVAKDPDSAKARECRARTYVRLGKLEKAIEDCNAALKINAKLADAYVTRAEAERSQNELAKALEDFSKALDQNPERADALAARGTLYQQMAEADSDGEQSRKRLDRAVKDFDKLLKLDGRDTASFVRRAEIMLALGDYQSTIDDCSKALEIDPKFAAARIARARGFLAKEDFDKAVEDCDAAIGADAVRPDAYVVRATARVEKSAEMQTLADVAACDKAADDCRTAVSLAAKVKGDADEMRRVKKSIAVVHELRGSLYDGTRAGKKAFDEYTAAIALDPALTDALVRRAVNRVKGEDYPAALADCNAAIEIDNSRPEGYYGRGLVYRAQQKYAEAIKDFEEALTRKYSKAYRGLATTYSALAAREHAKVADLQKKPGGRNSPNTPRRSMRNIRCGRSVSRTRPRRWRPIATFRQFSSLAGWHTPIAAVRNRDLPTSRPPLPKIPNWPWPIFIAGCISATRTGRTRRSRSLRRRSNSSPMPRWRTCAAPRLIQRIGDELSEQIDFKKFKEAQRQDPARAERRGHFSRRAFRQPRETRGGRGLRGASTALQGEKGTRKEARRHGREDDSVGCVERTVRTMSGRTL